MKVHVSDISFADCYQFKTNTVNQWIKTKNSFQLWVRIAILFFEYCAENNEILYIFDQENYTIDKINLKHFWKKLELIQQISWFNWKKADEKFCEIVLQELNKKFIEKYEYKYLYYHFHNQMHLIFR